MKFTTLKTILHAKNDCKPDDIIRDGDLYKCTNCGEKQEVYNYEEVRRYWALRGQ